MAGKLASNSLTFDLINVSLVRVGLLCMLDDHDDFNWRWIVPAVLIQLG